MDGWIFINAAAHHMRKEKLFVIAADVNFSYAAILFVAGRVPPISEQERVNRDGADVCDRVMCVCSMCVYVCPVNLQ